MLLWLEVGAERLASVSVERNDTVVVVVDHRQHADPVAEPTHGVDERLPPQGAVLVLERRGEADRILDRRRLEHEPAVLVALVVHRVRRDRIDHVRVLRLVEEPVDETHRMKPEVAADQPAARALRQTRSQQELWRVERPRCDDHGPRLHANSSSILVDVLNSSGLAVLDHDALDVRPCAQLEAARRPGIMDVGVERRLAGVRRATLQARATAHAVRVGVRAHGLEVRPERTEALLDRVNALLPVGALTHTEARLDPVVVRVEVGGAERAPARPHDPTRGVPLGVVVVGDAKRDLRVHRCRTADAARTEKRNDSPGATVNRGEADRPPEVVVRLRLPAGEVGRRTVRAALEEQDRAPAIGELACDDAATGARSHDDDVEALAHPTIPRYDQSFLRRVASGVLKSISSQAPVASTPGATKSL